MLKLVLKSEYTKCSNYGLFYSEKQMSKRSF